VESRAWPVVAGDHRRGGGVSAFSDQWVDCTDSCVIDIAAKGRADDAGYWPTMIQLDFYEDGCTITSNDARDLAAMLVKAADSADAIDDARFAEQGR
jgi:hypothetical protein